MTLTHDEILEAAISGESFKPRSLAFSLPEKPWKYWRAGSEDWAVYFVAGSRVGDTTVESVNRLLRNRFKPLLVVRDYGELAAVAKRYLDLRCHIVFPIAGRGTLIPPLDFPTIQPKNPRRSTRIPRNLLNEIEGSKEIPAPLRKAIRELCKNYRKIRYSPSHDREERDALMKFLKRVLNQIGFSSSSSAQDTVDMIRRLEIAGWGGDRDHFFHSFQNYLFGIVALMKLSPYFALYKDAAKIHWDINPFDVWLLVSLWHDAGYGVSRLEHIYDGILGPTFDELWAEDTRATFLKSDIAKEALLNICILIARLLNPEEARTELMIPKSWPRNPGARLICQAFEESLMGTSHSAPSSLRLYADFMPMVKKLGVTKKDLLTQVVLMACASLPFHEERFRSHLRFRYGEFPISTKIMPFAALLTFIDSIQEDHRDLEIVTEELRFLEKILVRRPATVMARVNRDALPLESLILKAIEVRHVLAYLGQDLTGLYFKYPDWIVD